MYKDRPAPEPTEVECPNCHQQVGTEKLHGRVRTVTTTVVHLKPGPTAKVCHAILSTKENR